MTTLRFNSPGIGTNVWGQVLRRKAAATRLRLMSWVTIAGLLYWLVVTGFCAMMWRVLFQVSEDTRRVAFASLGAGLRGLDVMTIVLAIGALAEAGLVVSLLGTLGKGRMRLLIVGAIGLAIVSFAMRLMMEMIWRHGPEADAQGPLVWAMWLQASWVGFVTAYALWHMCLARACMEMIGAQKRLWVRNWTIVLIDGGLLLLLSLLAMEQPDRAVFLYVFWILFGAFMSYALIAQILMLRTIAKTLD